MERHLVLLSPSQCKQLDSLVSLLSRCYPIEYVICFGFVNDSKVSMSCFSDELKNVNTHYFLLAITSDTARIEHEVQDYVNQHFDGASVTLLVHSFEAVTEAISNVNRFFNLVCRDGMLVYSKNGLRLNVEFPPLENKNVLEKAERAYFHRYNRAVGFTEAAKECFDKGYFPNAVFMLHQAVEQACIAMISVCLSYRADIHNLSRLLNLTLCFSREPSAVFQRNTAEEQRLFQLLLRSYSDARYLNEYVVSKDDAEALLKQVNPFIQLTESICTGRIDQLRTGLNAPSHQAL